LLANAVTLFSLKNAFSILKKSASMIITVPSFVPIRIYFFSSDVAKKEI